VKDGVPYAIDFMNPAPDMDVNSLTPHYFEWVATHMADLVIRLAHETPAPVDLARGEYLIGRREGGRAAAVLAAAPAGAQAAGAVTDAMSGEAPSAGWRPSAGASTTPPDSLGSALGRALDDAFGGTAAGLGDATPAPAAKERRKAAAPRRKKEPKADPSADGQAG
jgi:hypothetical protein